MPIITELKDHILTVRINRRGQRNAVSPRTATDLYEAFLAFERDDTAKVAVLTGDDTAFCAGFDLKAAAAGLDADWLARHAIPDDWDDPQASPLPSPMGPARLMLSKPVIAAIEGAAVAGGTELALWCDVRIAARSAFLGIFCRRWGVPLVDGGTVRLPRIVGAGHANDMILTGRPVAADEAMAMGLINRVTEDGQALRVALDYARSLLRYPQGCMLADLSAAGPAPRDLADGLRREWRSSAILVGESRDGAARFASGKGRSGDFGDI